MRPHLKLTLEESTPGSTKATRAAGECHAQYVVFLAGASDVFCQTARSQRPTTWRFRRGLPSYRMTFDSCGRWQRRTLSSQLRWNE
jgi:hypothetical protein